MATHDPYSATATAYDLFNGTARPGQLAAMETLLPLLQPDHGPILDIGAGSGLNTCFILDRLPGAHVCALEPSPAMRSLALTHIAARPEWFGRVTLRPEDFFSAPLPATLGGAILLGVIGHFDAEERAAILAELALRLPGGGTVLIDLQEPTQPERVMPYEFTAAQIGDLTYRVIAEAWPVSGELMSWRMSYVTVEGERVLTEDTTTFDYRHPSPEVVSAEAAEAGLSFVRLGDTSFWLLQRS